MESEPPPVERGVGVAGAVAGAALVSTILLGACGDGGSPVIHVPSSMDRSTVTTTTPGEPHRQAKVIEVDVAGGAPRGGVRTERVTLGKPVLLRVTSDVEDEVHVHGYNLVAAVAPGAPVELAFDATIPGVFEIELEQRHRRILDLEVRPE